MSFYNLYDAITYQSDAIESIPYYRFKEIQDYNIVDMVLFNLGASYLFKSRYSMYFPEKPNLYKSRLNYLYMLRYYFNTFIYSADYSRFKNRFSPFKIFSIEFIYGFVVGQIIGMNEYVFTYHQKGDVKSGMLKFSEQISTPRFWYFSFSRGIHAAFTWGLYFSLSSCLYHGISHELVFKKFGISLFSNIISCLFSFPIYFVSIHIKYFKPSEKDLRIADLKRDFKFLFIKRDPHLQAGLLYMIEHIILGTIYLTWIDSLYFI
jgi:hypothetical protein